MGIDYALEWPCEPRRALSTALLVGLVKQRRTIDSILSQLPPGKTPSEITIQRVVTGPRGPVRESATLQQMLDETRALDTHASACVGCPANGKGDPYGCVDYIPYPIEPSTESWTLSLLPQDAESTAGTFLRSALREMSYDGDSARELRGKDAGLFSLSNAAVRSWADGTIVTFDQVFEMLFMVERVDPPHGMILLLLMGLLPYDLPPDDILRLQREGSYRASLLSRPQAVPMGLLETEVPIFRYLVALRRAAALSATVLISY